MGGFHLVGKTEEELKNVVNGFERLGVEKVAPCHCSGDLARNIFKEEYKDDYVDVGVGKEVKVV